MKDRLRRIGGPLVALAVATVPAISQPPEAKAGSGVDTAQEQFVYLPDWRCDVKRLGKYTLETDVNVRPFVSIGDESIAITYQRNKSDEDGPPVFSTVIYDSSTLQRGVLRDPEEVYIVQEPTVLTFFSEDCDGHVPPADRDLYH